MENLICKNAGKSYKEKTVLKNVNLELEPGKIYGLIGRSGAGKTTLLSLMSAQNPVSGAGSRWHNSKIYRKSFIKEDIDIGRLCAIM